MIKITLDYDNGLVFPDSKLLDSLRALLIKGEDFSIGSDLACTCLRVLFVRGDAPSFELFDIEGKPYKLQDDGMLDRWPSHDVQFEYLGELMGFRIDNNKGGT